MRRKKWDIPGLGSVTRFRTAARRILSHRLSSMLALLERMRKEASTDVLHELRIAIRRLRYPLETLAAAFERKRIREFLDALNRLQDVAGEARDLDVFIDRLRRYGRTKSGKIPPAVLIDLARRREERYRACAEHIEVFLGSRSLSEFKREIRYPSPRRAAKRMRNADEASRTEQVSSATE